jgi:hypothetical protein
MEQGTTFDSGGNNDEDVLLSVSMPPGPKIMWGVRRSVNCGPGSQQNGVELIDACRVFGKRKADHVKPAF